MGDGTAPSVRGPARASPLWLLEASPSGRGLPQHSMGQCSEGHQQWKGQGKEQGEASGGEEDYPGVYGRWQQLEGRGDSEEEMKQQMEELAGAVAAAGGDAEVMDEDAAC